MGTVGPGTARAKLPKTHRFRKGSCGSRRKGMGTDQQSGKPKQPQWQTPNRATSPSCATTKGRKVPTPDSGSQPRPAQNQGGTGAGPPAQTPLTPNLPSPPTQTPTIPQWKPSALLAWWTLPVLPVDLPHRDTYCLRKEIPVAGRLVYFLPF